MFSVAPIAYFFSSSDEKRDVPRQGALEENRGVLRFLSHKNFEQALQDLEGIERIWLLFWMHCSSGWKPKVLPPGSPKKRGLFATRSPHRPNPIGLSCVRLLSVQGLELEVEAHDLLDGTPILDIKPYLPYADSFPSSQTGWIRSAPQKYAVTWSVLAQEQVHFVESREEIFLKKKLDLRLVHFTPPSSSNRTRRFGDHIYLMAYKTWRCLFSVEGLQIVVICLFSGYDSPVLKQDSSDLLVHKDFMRKFEKEIASYQHLRKY